MSSLPICYIVGAGESVGLDFRPGPKDLLIAADGGYAAVQQVGLRPDLVIGDFDSLGHAPQAEQIITLPTVKDVTDSWAAVEQGLQRGYRRFALYNCTGGRFEHTLANLQMAADLAARGCECRIFSRSQVYTALANGTMEFDPAHSGFLSVFSHTDRCTGVCLKGLKYELENAELSNRFPLGVSNEFLGLPSTVTIGSGIALLVFDRTGNP